VDRSIRDELLEAALGYHALGFRLVPVAFKGKCPTDGEGWQTEHFRLNPDQVRATWAVPHNVGILLGPESRDLADVDLDCEEALALADEYLPAGAWIFGRPGRPRSHRIYVSPGAHSITLKGLDKKELLGLRAKPANGTGHQTVFPPSAHETGERIAWEGDADGDAELPAAVDSAALSAAVRQLAVHVFLARHLGGVDAARSYLQQPIAGRLTPEVAAHARALAGLGPAAGRPRRPSSSTGGRRCDVLEKLRAAGIEATAALFDLAWDDRKRALVVCPGCGCDCRSSTDRRAAAGVVRARLSGVELAVHGKCGFTGDAIAVAAAAVLGTTKPRGRAQWRRLAQELRERGVA
jgi:bifunctional DNA primase/polymerase-like protein